MAGPNAKKSKQLIAEYLDKRVTAELDGTLFDHVPSRFLFRFEDPATLMEELAEAYSDELGNMDCLDDDAEWCNDDLIPVAAVSSIEEGAEAEADDDDDEDDDEGEDVYEFAWVFLNWKTSPPTVQVTTTDDWGDERTAKSLAALNLEESDDVIGERDAGIELRAKTLDAMTWLMVPLSLWAVVNAVVWTDAGIPVAITAPVLGYIPAATVLLFVGRRRAWPNATRALLLLGVFAVTALVVPLVLGPRMGGGAILLGALLVGAIYFGRRGLLVVGLVEAAAMFAIGAWFHWSGSIAAYETRVDQLQTWLVPAGTVLVLGAFLAIPLLHLLAGYESNIRALRSSIAAERAAARRIAASEARLRSLDQATFEGISITVDGELLDCNEQYAAIYGYSRDALIGKNIRDMVAPESAAAVEDAIATNRTAAYEAVAIGEGGRRIDLEVRARQLVLDGRPVRLAAVRDVTERKRAEAEQQRLIEELRAKNAEMEQFTYTVSHDLKSPLITIKGFVGQVADDLARGEVATSQADLARVARAADRMLNLLQDLLDLSRVGRTPDRREVVALGDVAAEVVEQLRGSLDARHVEIAIAPDLPVVLGDRVRLAQVLQNLVENAIKYMGAQASPRIEITTRADPERALCGVRDNGIGIDPRHTDRIFRLFEKLDPRSEGTGVGLALVKRIVELHGGETWVESEGSGRGSCAWFALPRAPS